MIVIVIMDIVLDNKYREENIASMKSNRSEESSKINEICKPKLFRTILFTLIYVAPYGHLWLNIIEKKYEKLVPSAAFAGIGLIIIGSIWTLYLVRFFRYSENCSKNSDEYVE